MEHGFQSIVGEDQTLMVHNMKIIQVTNKMQLFILLIDSNTLHVLGISRPLSGVQELCVRPMVLAH